MRFYNHITCAVLFFLVFAYLTDISNPLLGVFFAAWISLYPDLLDKLLGKHRNMGHSILWLIPFSLVVVLNPLVAAALIVGFLSHIFMDIFTVHGCPLLYPFRETGFVCLSRRRRVKTGTNQDKAIFIFLIFLIIPLFLLNINMLPVMDPNLAYASNTSTPNTTQTIKNDISMTFRLDEVTNKNLTIQKVNENTTTIVIKDIGG